MATFTAEYRTLEGLFYYHDGGPLMIRYNDGTEKRCTSETYTLNDFRRVLAMLVYDGQIFIGNPAICRH